MYEKSISNLSIYTKSTENRKGNNFECSVTLNGKTFHASDAIKKESEQKVAALILLELDIS